MKFTFFFFLFFLSVFCETSPQSNSMREKFRKILEENNPASSFHLLVNESFQGEKSVHEQAFSITIEFPHSLEKVHNLCFLSDLPRNYRYDVNVKGKNLLFPNMNDLPIVSLTITDLERSLLTKIRLPEMLEGLCLYFSDRTATDLSKIISYPPKLRFIALLFNKSASLKLNELEKFKSIEELFIGQRSLYQNSPYKIQLIPPQENLYFTNLKKLIVRGPVDNFEFLLKSANQYKLSIWYGIIDAKLLFDNKERITEIALVGCQIRNPEYLKKIPNVKIVPPSKDVPLFSEQPDNPQTEKQQNIYRGFPAK